MTNSANAADDKDKDQDDAPTRPAGGGGKAQRRLRNFLLDPLLQVKIGLYAIILSVLFAAALGFILYHNFHTLVADVVELTDAKQEVEEYFQKYWLKAQIWVYLSFAVYIGATIAVSVIYTHRLIGPTIAFRRHLRSLAEGRYGARTYLRKGDAFFEVADELNSLSEVLERKNGGPAK